MPSEDPYDVLKTLSQQDKVLIICNYQLYDGDWDAIERDLRERLAGRPFVLKLGQRIKEDLKRVKRLRKIEKQYEIKLGDYVKV